RLLIDKFSASSDVYQYHPLFREFLISRARSILGPEEINAIMETAGHLLVEAGYIEDAVDLYTQAEQLPSLAGLIHRYAVELLQQGRFRTLEHWIERLPADALNDLPWMSFWLGMSRLHAFPAKARTVFEAAFTAFNAQGDISGTYLSYSGIIESFLYEWNDFTLLDPWIVWFEEHHQDDQIYPSPAIEARITVSMMCALMFRQPDRADINQWVERALTLSRKHGDIRLCIEAWDWAVTYYCWLGNFARADIIKQETSHAMQAYQQDPAVMLHLKWLDIAMNIFTSIPDDSVLEQIHEALSTGEKTGIHIWDQMFLTNGIYAALMLGNLPEAKKFIEKLESQLDPARYHGNSLYHMGLVIYYMLSGEMVRALEHARRAYSITEETGYIFPHIICKFALAQVLVEIEEFRQAQKELDEVYETSLRTHSSILEFMSLLARSRLAFRQGMPEKGFEFLQDSITIGRKHSFRTMIWWWQPSMMSDLLKMALAAGIEIDYVREMIRAYKVVPDPNAYTSKDWPWVFAIKTLGGFEIRKNDQVLIFNGKAHKKPFELLKILIAFGSRGVPVDKITDELWPEADGDMAHSALTTTLNRLRTILECKKIIEHRDGRLSLNMQICHVDSKAFTGLLEKARSVLEKGDQAEASVFMETALKLYHGHFLEEDNHSKWTISSREQLKDRFIDTAITLGRYLEKQKEYERAISWYRRGTKIDPTNECFYQNRMVCHHNMGQYPEVEKTYLLCRNMLENLLGVYPSQKTMQVYENIRKSQSTPNNPNT
ncbi:MAG: hypothetical protein JW920_03215, partial [Deltaproteobacteria bacterium]|nr:hypothetical protein [Deltaproteobacteria bacterium]